jgi:hypothetical protein
MFQPKRMRQAGHVTPMGKRRNAYRDLVGETDKKIHSEGSDSSGNIILKLIFKK